MVLRLRGGVKQLETKAEFHAALAEAGEKLVVVDFTATWCGPCQRIAPKFAQWADEYTDVVFVKVDVDDNEDTAQECGVSAMPTFKYFKGGKVVFEVVGADPGAIKAAIDQHK